MPLPLAVPIVASGLTSLLSGILGNRSRTQRTTSTTTPTYDPLTQGLRGQIARRLTSRLGQGSMLPQSVGNQMIANTNQVFQNLGVNQRNNAAISGQIGGPQDLAQRQGLDIARGSEIISSLNTLPLLERQMDNENIGLANDFTATGRGSTTTGTGTQQGSLAAGLGQGIDDFSGFLGLLFGSGAFGGGGRGGSGAGGLGEGIGASLGSGAGLSGWHRWLQMASQGGLPGLPTDPRLRNPGWLTPAR